MTVEAESDDRFMQKKGDLFIARGLIHVLDSVGTGFTPADSECEEYTAVCGLESQSWSMPAQGIYGADFIPSLTVPEARSFTKCQKCFKENIETSKLNEAIIKINESLTWPYYLRLDSKGEDVVFNMGNNMTDESGGGSYRNIEYYTFPAKALSQLVATPKSSNNAEVVTNGFWDIDYENWPYGRDDGQSIHADHDPVVINLKLETQEEKYLFEASHKALQQKVETVSSEINQYGREILKMVAECRSKAVYKCPGNVYGFLNDPVIPDFGDLKDLDTPCELVFDKYYTPETSSDGDYSEERRKILYFDKKMVINALSNLEPNKTLTVKGSGRAVHFLERAGYGYNHNENTVEINIDNEVEVTMGITYFKNGELVIFNFDSLPIDAKNKYRLYGSIALSSKSASYSDLLV